MYLHLEKLRNNPKRKIKTINPEDLFKEFVPNEFGISLDAEVTMIMKGQNVVEGATSDYEAWLLAVLAKKANNIFEFGTCTGKTSYLFAKNSMPEAKIFTLTLPPEEAENYIHSVEDSTAAKRAAISESKFVKFIYSGTEVENKIQQIFSDSKKFSETEYENTMDLIFIDGSHAYSYIKSDTEKAMKMLKSGGLILWHDYRDRVKTVDGVCKYLDELSETHTLYHINGTSLVVFQK